MGPSQREDALSSELLSLHPVVLRQSLRCAEVSVPGWGRDGDQAAGTEKPARKRHTQFKRILRDRMGAQRRCLIRCELARHIYKLNAFVEAVLNRTTEFELDSATGRHESLNTISFMLNFTRKFQAGALTNPTA